MNRFWIVFVFTAVVGFTFSCKTQKTLVNVAPEKTGRDAMVPQLEWDKTLIEFGKIQKGDQRAVEYTFTNVSDVPIQIEIATTCHCTQITYPPTAKVFNKGDSGTIKGIFDSSEKEVSEKIDITIILTNTDSKGYPIVEELFFSYEF